MPDNLIEGIGYDVTYAFADMFTFLAILMAWWSTRVNETIGTNQGRVPLNSRFVCCLEFTFNLILCKELAVC